MVDLINGEDRERFESSSIFVNLSVDRKPGSRFFCCGRAPEPSVTGLPSGHRAFIQNLQTNRGRQWCVYVQQKTVIHHSHRVWTSSLQNQLSQPEY